MRWCLIVLLCFVAPLWADDAVEPHILFLARSGRVQQAIDEYRNEVVAKRGHDFSLLHRMGLLIVSLGQQSKSPEGQLMTLYGAAVAQDERLFPVLRAALFSSYPEIQLIAVDMLADCQTDEADQLLLHAMGSPHPIIRFEAGYQLVKHHHQDAVGQLRALQAKIIPEAHPLFPQLYALAGTVEGDAALRRMLAGGSSATRRAAILSIARFERDDFIPEIRRLIATLDPLQQEVCCVALGHLQDSESWQTLQNLTRARESFVAIAALNALWELGDESGQTQLQQRARKGDLFAISALAKIEGSEDFLAGLIDHEDVQVRTNAALALLLLRDERCIMGIAELLMPDERDFIVLPLSSPGGGLTSFRLTPNGQQRGKKDPALLEISKSFREQLLVEAVELEERSFLWLANQLFRVQQNDLIPLLVRLLESHATSDAFALLEREQHRAGAPLIRGYCNLALYRADRPGPHAEELREWLVRQQGRKLLEMRSYLPWNQRVKKEERYRLTPEESARLFVESLEALAQRRDLDAVDVLLSAIADGHEDNRYALAGLLLKVTE